MLMKPRSEAELAELIAGARDALAIEGGGTRPVGARAGQALSVAGLSGITRYEPGALTLVAQAGTPLSVIEAALGQEGQRLAFEPMDHRSLLGSSGVPTLGGMVASNASGPRRVQLGACRDFLLGVRFVDGTGRVIKNGGRVMKNVTGYDLSRLLAGSWGTLGVLSEVSFKVLPVPEASASLRIEVASPGAGVQVMQRALATPYEVSGAASDGRAVWLRVEGFEAQVRYRLGALQDLLGGEEVALDWAGVRDVAAMAELPLVWRVGLRPSRMGEMLDMLDALYGSEVLLDWGGGLAWIGFNAAHLDEARSYGDGESGAEVIRAHMHHNAALLGGYATMVKGPEVISPVFQPQPEAVVALSRGLKARFDPRGILNPGRMG